MDLFHALNRGVDGRHIFMDEQDYFRFVHDIYEFNDVRPAGSTYYSFKHNPLDNLGFVNPDYENQRSKRERLVDVHGWVLMQNHYHLLLSERSEGGLSLFLRKLNVGYANYFNEKYERKGTLFQGRTKKILIEREAHFLYILHYIHLNPLDYFEGNEGWRVREKGGVRNVKKALEYLSTYRWSSYLDYIGTKNFPSLLSTSRFKNKDVFENYKKEIAGYLRDIETESLSSLTLE
jgi:putative transposase